MQPASSLERRVLLRCLLLPGFLSLGGCEYLLPFGGPAATQRDARALDALPDRPVSDGPTGGEQRDGRVPDSTLRVDGTEGCPCPASDPALIACYLFNAGNPALDGSKNGYDLTLTNATSGDVHQGSALGLTGLDSYAKLPSSSCLPVNTIELWFKANTPPAAGARAGLLDKDGEYGIFLQNQGLTVTVTCVIDGVSTTAPLVGSQEATPWNYVACVRDTSSGVKIYLNAAPGVPGIISSPGSCNADLLIGANSNIESTPNEFFDGWIDSVRLWKTARTATQIADAFKGSCL